MPLKIPSFILSLQKQISHNCQVPIRAVSQIASVSVSLMHQTAAITLTNIAYEITQNEENGSRKSNKPKNLCFPPKCLYF